MMLSKNLLVLILFAGTSFFSSCHKDSPVPETKQDSKQNETLAVYAGWPENFETGSKGSYAAADVTLGTGSWNLSDALLGTSTSDAKNGTKSVRMQNTGMITMNFNLTNGAASVTVQHAKYGTDATSTWGLWYSTNSGSTWTQAGSNVTTSTTTLSAANFTLSVTGNVRFQLRKLSGGRLNIDDFSVNDNNNTAPTQDDNLAMGNPSGAVTNVGSPNNYLMVKSQYTLAYDDSRKTPKWVSWHLSSAWKGSAVRCDCFTSDAALPSGWQKVTTGDYTNNGFTRGHMCPSEDRDLTDADNAATFIMTNILPQSSNNNSGTWGSVEDYTRSLLASNNEMYIISGGYGMGGSYSSTSGTINTITGTSGRVITVPSRLWKVIVILPVGSNDVSRVSTSTRVIAIDTPNTYNSTSLSWGSYRTTVDAIEAATGLNLLSNVPTTIQNTIEAVVDNGPTL